MTVSISLTVYEVGSPKHAKKAANIDEPVAQMIINKRKPCINFHSGSIINLLNITGVYDSFCFLSSSLTAT